MWTVELDTYTYASTHLESTSVWYVLMHASALCMKLNSFHTLYRQTKKRRWIHVCQTIRSDRVCVRSASSKKKKNRVPNNPRLALAYTNNKTKVTYFDNGDILISTWTHTRHTYTHHIGQTGCDSDRLSHFLLSSLLWSVIDIPF